MSINVNLSPESGADLINLLNSISGMENARRLLPIHDALVAAFKRHEAEIAAEKAKPISDQPSTVTCQQKPHVGFDHLPDSDKAV